MPSPRPPRRAAIRVVLATLVALAACGDGPTPPTIGPEGITIVSGADVADTILTQLARPLVVQVRDSAGRRLRGAVVRFAALPVASPLDPRVIYASASPLRSAGGNGMSMRLDTTDANGLVTTHLMLGPVAGEGGLEIRVEQHAYVDTARFTVRPGRPTRLVIAPGDTAILEGGSATLAGVVRDQFGNARADAVQWRVLAGDASVAANGVVTMPSRGVANIEAAFGGMADTAFVAAVPDGALSAFHIANGAIDAVLLRTDGSSRRAVRQVTTATWTDWTPAWSRASAMLLFQLAQPGGGPARIWVADTLGSLRRLTGAATPTFHETWPQVSESDGRVYFTNRADGWTHTEIWRTPLAAGGAAEPIATGRQPGMVDAHPAPSPDGRRLLFASNRATGGSEFRLYLLDLASGVVADLGVDGSLPRWSPSGDRVAYVRNENLRVMNADGSGDRLVMTGMLYPYSWSPDGEWIVGFTRIGAAGSTRFVHVASGRSAGVPGTRDVHAVAWAR